MVCLVFLLFVGILLSSPFCDGEGEGEGYNLPVFNQNWIDRSEKKSEEAVLSYNLPVFPGNLFQGRRLQTDPRMKSSGEKKIPKNVWVSTTNVTKVLTKYEHMVDLMEEHKDWTWTISDNAEKDEFMRKTYPDTSLLWAYETINPDDAGVSRSDIWRYAALYAYGGIYMDSDSNFYNNFDDLIRNDDEAVIAYEGTKFQRDWCYTTNCMLHGNTLGKLFPSDVYKDAQLTNSIVQWMMVIAPNHIFLRKTLENFVYAMKREYLGMDALKINKYDPSFVKHVYCLTGPQIWATSVSMAMMDVILANSQYDNLPADMQIEYRKWRFASRDYIHEGAVAKYIHDPHEMKGTHIHYTKNPSGKFFIYYGRDDELIREMPSYLHSPDFDMSLISGKWGYNGVTNYHNMYLVYKGQKRRVLDETFAAWNLTLNAHAQLSDRVLDIIPDGPDLLPNSTVGNICHLQEDPAECYSRTV